jgi:sulfur carrier protein ThiS adenylyltransferase
MIFAGCDIIVEAFDQASEKEMLIETVQEKMPGIPLIIGSGMAGWGKSDLLKCKKADEFLYVCGDESSEVSEELPCLAPRVGIVSNMQANLVLEILLLKEKKNSG